jgi:hypothetical protein
VGGGGGGKVWTLKREGDNGGIWEWWGICAVDRYNDGGGCYMRGERGWGGGGKGERMRPIAEETYTGMSGWGWGGG